LFENLETMWRTLGRQPKYGEVAKPRSAFSANPFRTGFGPFGKFMTANETMDKIHKARVPEPHW
jgi:hypothetical protein